MTFEEFRIANVKRCEESFRPIQDGEWTVADWSNAMAGECGEACNVVKKLRRISFVQNLQGSCDDLRRELAYELADILAYAFLLAEHQGIDLAAAAAEKFNIVSRRVGSDVTLQECGPILRSE